METLDNILSKDELDRFNAIMNGLKNGSIKKWTLPNHEEEFDEDVALENFKTIVKSGIVQEQMEKAKARYGE